MKNDIILKNITNIHFIGIGGISLSALAKLMQSVGKNVTGSDIKSNELISNLKKLDIKVFLSHKKKHIKNAELVVYTSAIKNNNPEYLEAKKRNILLLSRAEFLGLIAKDYQEVIAISGSHGKTTTCGMLASIFSKAGLKPTVHIGGESEVTNGNLLIGDKNFFITEACEYKDSFLQLFPNISVILNMEYDHSDYFKSVEVIFKSFSRFANNAKNRVVIEEKYESFIDTNNECTTFGFCNANYTAKNITLNEEHYVKFDCYKDNEFFAKITLKSALKHNVYNALASICVADFYHIKKTDIIDGLYNFIGIKRRFEKTGVFLNSTVIHDYAHHPTEIASTIKNCKDSYNKNIIAIFQPHTYSRTKSLMKEFLQCFKECEKVIILKTYKARERKIKGGTAKDLYKNLKKIGTDVSYFNTFKKVKSYLIKNTIKDSMILVLGAGSIEELAREYLK